MLKFMRGLVYICGGAVICCFIVGIVCLFLPALGFPKLQSPTAPLMYSFFLAFIVSLILPSYNNMEAAEAQRLADAEAAERAAEKAAAAAAAPPASAAVVSVAATVAPVAPAPTPVSSAGKRGVKQRHEGKKSASKAEVIQPSAQSMTMTRQGPSKSSDEDGFRVASIPNDPSELGDIGFPVP